MSEVKKVIFGFYEEKGFNESSPGPELKRFDIYNMEDLKLKTENKELVYKLRKKFKKEVLLKDYPRLKSVLNNLLNGIKVKYENIETVVVEELYPFIIDDWYWDNLSFGFFIYPIEKNIYEDYPDGIFTVEYDDDEDIYGDIYEDNDEFTEFPYGFLFDEDFDFEDDEEYYEDNDEILDIFGEGIKLNKFDELKELFSKYDLGRENHKLPYKNVVSSFNEYNDNCLIGVMTKVYNSDAKSKDDKIALKSIERYFKDKTDVNTMLGFFDKYKINYEIKDITGRNIAFKNDNNNKRKRKKFRGIIYDNHIYLYENNRGNFKLKFEQNDYRNPSYMPDKLDSGDSTGHEFFKELNNNIVNNFSYISEQSLYPIALGRKIDFSGSYISYDMRKCYYTVLHEMSIDDYFKSLYKNKVDPIFKNIVDLPKGDDLIPIFSCMDMIREYKGGEIERHYIYFLKTESMKKLERFGFIRNFLHGFNISLFLYYDIIDRCDIEYYRSCCRTINVDYLIEKIEKIDLKVKSESEKPYSKENLFRLCNGLMGKKYSDIFRVAINITNELDYEIINAGRINKLKKEEPEFNDENNEANKYISKLEIMKGKNRYLYFNSRSIYDYIVNRANFFINATHLEFEELGLEITNIKTDSLGVKINSDLYYDNSKLDPNHVLDKYFEKGELEKIDNIISKTKLGHLFRKENIYVGKYEGKNLRSGYNIKQIKNDMENELYNMTKKMYIVNSKPGTGKTYHMKNNEYIIKDQNLKEYDYAMTIANLCCRNMDTERITADTIHKSFGLLQTTETRYKVLSKYKNKSIWMDEFSMFSPDVFDNIIYLSTITEKIFITGDINQIPPVGYSDLFKDKKEFIDIFLKDAINFKKDYRNDTQLIKFRDCILSEPNNSELVINTLKKLINNCRGYKSVDYDIHIAYTNNLCDYINYKMLASKKLICNFEEHYYDKGVKLMAAVTSKNQKIYKSDIYHVDYCNLQKKLVGLIRERDNKKIELKHKLIAKMFRLGYCRTVHSVQGLTLDNNFVLHNTIEMYKVNTSILYTAITRAKSLKQIIFKKSNIPRDFNKLHPEIKEHRLKINRINLIDEEKYNI